MTNNGGVLQFTNAAPVITPLNIGDFVIANGTVSFRAITNADVRCNQSGKPLSYLTKFNWFGANAFRLNNATNVNSSTQAYSFWDVSTPRIFVRLELLNGSMYRGGDVYIGDGGSLYLSGGASTISQGLIADMDSTVEFDLRSTNAPGCLLLASTAEFDGCNLQLDLANPPIVNTPFLIISNTMADTVVGEGSTIGANVFLTSSVPPHSLVVQEEAKVKVVSKKERSRPPEDYYI